MRVREFFSEKVSKKIVFYSDGNFYYEWWITGLLDGWIFGCLLKPKN